MTAFFIKTHFDLMVIFSVSVQFVKYSSHFLHL
jgi:hypothetical protein